MANGGFVPAGGSGTVQGLTAFLLATSNPNDYGRLNLYITPRGQSVVGPVQADTAIAQDPSVSQGSAGGGGLRAWRGDRPGIASPPGGERGWAWGRPFGGRAAAGPPPALR